MVEANNNPVPVVPEDADLNDLTDEQFEAMRASFPKLTPEEEEKEMEEWINHPLNCKELTPEMLDRPEFQALQAMAFEGTPMEVQNNFKNHAYNQLGHLLMKTTKNKEKDF